MAEYSFVQSVVTDAVAVVTISRPEKLNALNKQVLAELDEIFSTLAQDASVRCIVITGAGQKAFVAGADIAEMNALDQQGGEELARIGQGIFNKIAAMKKPVIAAVNGFALGGGSELAWACHIRIASENAVFGQPEINLGLIPGYGGTQRLSRLLPKSKAYELLLTGNSITAQEALRLGLVSAVFPSEELLPGIMNLANKIAMKSGAIVELLMEAIRNAESPLEEGLKTEAVLFGKCFRTNDAKEGTAAFLEKRKPIFKHS
jgi:enoyl-CoA hydratase